MDGIDFTTDDLEDCAADRAMLTEMIKDIKESNSSIPTAREAGWIDRYQLADALGISPDVVDRLLLKMVESGAWETKKVSDPAKRRSAIRVYRKCAGS